MAVTLEVEFAKNTYGSCAHRKAYLSRDRVASHDLGNFNIE